MSKFRKHKIGKGSIADKKQLAEKKASTRKKIWSIFIAIVMIGSVAGFFSFSNSLGGTQEYKGNEFFEKDGTWRIKGDLSSIPFFALPSQVDYFQTDPSIKNTILNSAQIAVSYDATSNLSEQMALAQFSLITFINDYTNSFAIPAVLSETEFNLPVINCENARTTVIVIERGNNTGVTVNGNCITVTGRIPNDFIAASEKIKYEYLGIIE